ncbi:Dil domain-containing protein, partial [Cynara cardunculus var. scolymus]
ASNIIVGSQVWVEDPEVAWIDGDVLEIKGANIKIKCSSGREITYRESYQALFVLPGSKCSHSAGVGQYTDFDPNTLNDFSWETFNRLAHVTIKTSIFQLRRVIISDTKVVTNASHVYPKDPEAPPCGVDDMTKLAYLHEPGVLENLRNRYSMDEIYVSTCHWWQMVNEGISQSILVSGESGAGKTESTKSLMQYLAYMGGRRGVQGQRSVEQQVLESNPVLEAFGNAKTVRNNNSSRFGKFVEIQFNEMGRISGAAIRTYLLEQSRVCQVSDPERNYHCFYMLCAAPPKMPNLQDDCHHDCIFGFDRHESLDCHHVGFHNVRLGCRDLWVDSVDKRELVGHLQGREVSNRLLVCEKYKLGKPKTFHYLNQTNCYELSGVNESEEYLATRKAMDVVGISSDDQESIFRVVAAILHLGNTEFVKDKEPDSSKPKDDQSRCDEAALEDSFCKRVIVTRDESIKKSLDPIAAVVNRDALAKIVYSRLFDWLVSKINNSIGQDPESKSLIGVLDIYGFESFKTNSFEQFCINLTNEKLQQHFNQHVFKMEQEEYTKEQIDWSYIEFVDNQDILDLIEKKPGGILALLDEACMFPRSTHETFAEKLFQTFKDHKRFSKPKLSNSAFTIDHYAGEVTYQTEFFLDKNKDYVIAEQQALLSASKCSFVSGLFPPAAEESSKTSKFSSIGTRFKQQLQALLETLSHTEPHYMRCVKPNNLLKPGIFENQNILQQLRCGGVMEAIRISCAGFPTRKPFKEFIGRFKIFAPDDVKKSTDDVKTSKLLLEKAKIKGYQIGKTKIFLRAGQMAELDARRSEVLGRSASIVQRKFLSHSECKKFNMLRSSSIQLQAVCRGHIGRHRFECRKRDVASLRLQKDGRMFLKRKSYKLLYSSAIKIQSGMRGLAARNTFRFKKQEAAAVIMQRQCRQYLARLRYCRLRKAAIATQSFWRARLARRELRKLRQVTVSFICSKFFHSLCALLELNEHIVQRYFLQSLLRCATRLSCANLINDFLQAARDTGALQEAKSKLEKEVEELTWRLQLEKRIRVCILYQTNCILIADVEEAKNQESAKLQSVLQEMQAQSQHAKELLLKEQEAAKKEIEQLRAGEEASNKEIVEKFTAENEKLKNMVSSLEQKIDETEKKYEESNKVSEERLKQATEAESKIVEMRNTMQSLQEKITDLEGENQLLRQQIMLSSASKRMSGRFSFSSKGPENGHHDPQTPMKRFDSSLRQSAIEKHRENVDTLIKAATEDLGFSNGKPVVTYIIYKSLVHWKVFEAERTSVFDRLIQVFGSAIQSFRKSPSYSNLEIVRQVDAKYPALLFKQQLTAYVEKIFGIVRDNLKKELSTCISSCIQVPLCCLNCGSITARTSKATTPPSIYWQNAVGCLNGMLHTLEEYHVPIVLAQKIFAQAFSSINVQLFNSLLLRRECCTFSHGEYVKAGLAELEIWCHNATEEYADSAWDELKHVRQAVGFLVIHQKSRISYDDLTKDLCSVLSVQQLYRICTLYFDDNYNTPSVAPEVITKLKASTEGLEDSENNSFLLEDDPCSLNEKEFAEIKPTCSLVENPEFRFLVE